MRELESKPWEDLPHEIESSPDPEPFDANCSFPPGRLRSDFFATRQGCLDKLDMEVMPCGGLSDATSSAVVYDIQHLYIYIYLFIYFVFPTLSDARTRQVRALLAKSSKPSLCICMYMYVYIYIYISICVCVYIFIYLFIYLFARLFFIYIK